MKNSKTFSDEDVIGVLLGQGLLSEAQAKTVFREKANTRRRIERDRVLNDSGRDSRHGIANPVSLVDVITALEFQRADDPSKILDEETVFQALAREWGIPYKKIDPLKLDLNLVTRTIPYTFARRHLVLPVAVEDGDLVVATPNPFNAEVFQDISQVSQLRVRPVMSPKSDIIRLIGQQFGFQRSILAAETQFGAPAVDISNLEQLVKVRSADEPAFDDRHIVNAVDHLFSYAFDQRASDVHIEPKRDKTIVRLRIDGVLHTVYELPKNVHSALISRIKALARLDMAEKRRPQDGRIKMEKGAREAEIRVSSIPVAFGEKVVMRIMDPDILFQDLESLGFESMDLMRYSNCIHTPHGIILVCGPTGSGKSTTLYSTLRTISGPEVNITTVEDPIEMVHQEFNQIAVQPVIGITFASILRHILRQDPDIIMIGEMRDLETAQNAVQAALTGHLVLSTLHTNDAPSSVTRMLDLGLQSFLIQATLVGILAQRLVRKICPHCNEVFEMEAEELAALGLDLGRKGKVSLYRGKGCLKCRGTGYLGRTGIFEVLPVTDAIRRQIRPECDTQTLRDIARKEGMATMRENAVRKLLQGRTTYQEVLRVTWEQM
ncbi:MAG: GspE/PulE family protein [Desulfobacteraceae bacterium]